MHFTEGILEDQEKGATTLRASKNLMLFKPVILRPANIHENCAAFLKFHIFI